MDNNVLLSSETRASTDRDIEDTKKKVFFFQGWEEKHCGKRRKFLVSRMFIGVFGLYKPKGLSKQY